MDLYKFLRYVELDVDDTFEDSDLVRWINKGISQFNLIPPLTNYPIIDEDSDVNVEMPFPDTFLLGILLPYVASAVKAQESSITEKQILLQEFVANARIYKSTVNTPTEFLLDQTNLDLNNYKLGDNVFISDMRLSPFAGDWQKASVFVEIVNEEEE